MCTTVSITDVLYHHSCYVTMFAICNPCQSSPSKTILVPSWFIIISLVFFYLLLVNYYFQVSINLKAKIAQNTTTELI